MPYQEILARAWAILKRQRALWLFGFLSACTGGTYGRLTVPGFNFQIPVNWQNEAPRHGQQPMPSPDQFQHMLEQIPPATILAVVLVIFAVLILWLVIALLIRSAAEPALLRGALADVRGSERLTVKEAFARGKPFFGRALLFYLLVGGGATVFGFLMLIMGIVLLVATLGIGVLCLLPLFLLAIPLIWLLELYLEIALLALILEDLPVLESFRRGWAVLKENFWNAVLMGLLLTVIRLAIGFMVGLLVVVLLFMFIVPLVVVGAVVSASGGLLVLLVMFGIGALSVVMAVALVASGMLQTYLQSAWVLTYLHFIGGEEPPREAEAPAAPPPPASHDPSPLPEPETP